MMDFCMFTQINMGVDLIAYWNNTLLQQGEHDTQPLILITASHIVVPTESGLYRVKRIFIKTTGK